MWALEAEPEFLIRIAQCVSCLLTKPVIRSDEGAAAGHGPHRVLEFLVQSSSEAFCASCVAFTTDLALQDVRRIFQIIEPIPQIQSGNGSCAACGRWQSVVRATIDAESDAQRVSEVGDVLSGHVRHRGLRIDLLSYRVGDRWRPFALVRSSLGALSPDVPPIRETVATKIDADELAAARAREWIDKRVP
jgi:hypothetical protein